MHLRRKPGLPLTAMVAVALGLAGTPAGMAAASAATPGAGMSCAAPAKGRITCAADRAGGTAKSASAMRAAAANPAGYGPSDLRSAYALTSASPAGGTGQTVAVVTAYDDATAEADLGTYRSQYSIAACTTANGCFSKVDQAGGTNYPSAGPAGWSLATAQTVDMISAICPNCHILLVEANSTAITDLGAAENEAVTLGAKFVTNTWFTPESTYGTSEPSYDTAYFSHPGVVITGADGNGTGYGTNYPAASPDVIAVGGTTLTTSTGGRGWTETAWSGTGSGCSPYEAKPSWQTDTGCANRVLNDVAAVADPSGSPIALYDATSGGWVTGGGNDIAASIVAAWFALGGAPAAGSTPAASLYANTNLLNDITSGSNGTCTPAYFCTAAAGYDGPSGLGSPDGPIGTPGNGLPGAPAVHNPVSGNQEVYANGGGNLEEIYWSTANGWSSWKNLGGNIAGRPVAIYNPGSGNLEVYARSSSNTLKEIYWSTANGWSNWKDLGGTIAGNPAAIYNPGSGNLEVYARGGGNLEEIYWSTANGWSNWKNLGGSITGSPAAVWNPADGALEVYAQSTSNTLWETYWRPNIGWKSQDLGGAIVASPAAVWNPAGNSLEVYATTAGNTLWESYWRSGIGWRSQGLGGSVNGTPALVANPVNGNLEVYAHGTGNTLQEIYWNSANGWSNWASKDTGIGGGPTALHNPVSGSLEVYALATDGSMREDYWNSSFGWKSKNLGSSFSDL